jgi:hypothetical protein
MSTFENATGFFEACDKPEGWEGCKQYVEDGATFSAQSEPVAHIHTVQDYCEWMFAFGTITSPEGSYVLHTSSFDNATNTASFFGTYHARHTGDGGPVPPTGKESYTHYVYVLKMSENGKVSEMTKIWNAPWAMKELGWM